MPALLGVGGSLGGSCSVTPSYAIPNAWTVLYGCAWNPIPFRGACAAGRNGRLERANSRYSPVKFSILGVRCFRLRGSAATLGVLGGSRWRAGIHALCLSATQRAGAARARPYKTCAWCSAFPGV